jgi:hypothetical protein
MARRKKRTSSHSSRATPLITYTVTVGHDPDAECDACGMPRQVLIEQEDDAWVCEACLHGSSYGELWGAAVVNGLYSWDGGW